MSDAYASQHSERLATGPAALSCVLSLLLFLLLCKHNAAMAYNKVLGVPRNNACAVTAWPDWRERRQLGYSLAAFDALNLALAVCYFCATF